MTFSPILSCKLAMVVTRSQLPHRSPIPLMVPCTCVAPASTATRAFAPTPRVVVGVDAYLYVGERAHRARHDRFELRRERPPIRVTENQRRRPRLGRCPQHL